MDQKATAQLFQLASLKEMHFFQSSVTGLLAHPASNGKEALVTLECLWWWRAEGEAAQWEDPLDRAGH